MTVHSFIRSRSFLIVIVFVAIAVIGGIAYFSIFDSPRNLDAVEQTDGVSSTTTKKNDEQGQDGLVQDDDPAHEHRIAGQVILPNGEPVPNAVVRISRPGDDAPREIRSDRGGNFQFSDLEMDLYAIEAEHTEYGPAYVIGVVPGGAALRLVLQTGKELQGRLLQHDSPVSGGTVHVGGPGVFPQRAQATATDGRFRMGGLRPGTYQVVAVAPGLSSGFLDDVSLDSDGAKSLSIEMRSAPVVTLSLRGKRDKQPIESGVVTISPRSVYTTALHTFIHDGEAIVDFLPAGEYWIRVRAPGYMPHEGRFWITREGGEVALTLKQGATVAGTVVDQAKNPIAGVKMRAVVETPTGADYELRHGIFEVFHRLARPDGTPFWWPSSDYTTDRRGRFEISGIPNGRVVITAQHDDYATGASQELRVQTDTRYDDVMIEMAHGVSLRGRVERENGGALAGALVSVASGSLPSWLMDASVLTDHSGAFHFTNLPPNVRIKVRHPDFGIVSQELELGNDGLDNVIIRMATPDLKEFQGRVLTTQKGPAQNAHVWLMSGNSTVPTCTAIADAKGLFASTSCTTKPDHIIIWHKGYAPIREEISNPTNAKDWILRAGGEMDVVTQRQPLHVEVEPAFFVPPQAGLHHTFDLDRWARRTLQQLTPGTYHVSCHEDQFVTATQKVRIQEGRRTEVVCPALQRIASESVIVVDAKGAPVAGAEVWFDFHSSAKRMTSNSKGRIELSGDPGKWVRVTATHGGWGQGSTAFQFSSEATEPYRVVLNEPIGGKDQPTFIATLNTWGLDVVPDNMSLIVDRTRADSPAANIGFRRGDEILWGREHGSSRLSVGIQRNGHAIVFDLLKDTP